MLALHASMRRAAAPIRQLFLAMSLGERRYVVPARDVVSVLADQPVAPLSAVPSWIGGVLKVGRTPVPVIDLVARVTGRPSSPGRTRRVVLLRLDGIGIDARGACAKQKMVGVWAEHVTETLMLDTAAFVSCGVQFPDARFLGPIVRHGEDWLQRLDVADLLEPEVRALLLEAVEHAAKQVA